MTKNAIGLILVDAPHSALNNAGLITSERDENMTAIKGIRRGGKFYPYVSAQAWRRWWRDTLEERHDWQMSPIERGQGEIAFTKADPFRYPDDDVFGYMRAQKGTIGTLTRSSPLKTSPLLSVFPQQPTQDFGVMARQTGNPVPHEHQFYSTVLKGIFALDLSSVGVFGQAAQTGFQNLNEKYIATKEIQQSIADAKAAPRDKNYVLPLEVRAERARQTIDCLPYLAGGAKQTLHHTDVAPKLVVLAVVAGGNNLFMNIVAPDEDKIINIAALREVLTDYSDVLLSDIYIGRAQGFLDALGGELETLSEETFGARKILVSSPKTALESFAASLDSHFED